MLKINTNDLLDCFTESQLYPSLLENNDEFINVDEKHIAWIVKENNSNNHKTKTIVDNEDLEIVIEICRYWMVNEFPKYVYDYIWNQEISVDPQSDSFKKDPLTESAYQLREIFDNYDDFLVIKDLELLVKTKMSQTICRTMNICPFSVFSSKNFNIIKYFTNKYPYNNLWIENIVNSGDIKSLDYLFNEYHDKNKIIMRKLGERQMLDTCIKNDYFECFKLLHKNGLNIFFPPTDYGKMELVANLIQNGNIDFFEYIINSNESIITNNFLKSNWDRIQRTHNNVISLVRKRKNDMIKHLSEKYQLVIDSIHKKKLLRQACAYNNVDYLMSSIFEDRINSKNPQIEDKDINELFEISVLHCSYDCMVYLYESCNINKSSTQNNTIYGVLDKLLDGKIPYLSPSTSPSKYREKLEKTNCFRIVKYLLEKTTINFYFDEDSILNAIKNTDIETIKYLINNFKKYSIPYIKQKSFLYACIYGDFDMIKYFVSNGGELTSLIFEACLSYQTIDVMNYLSENKCPPCKNPIKICLKRLTIRDKKHDFDIICDIIYNFLLKKDYCGKDINDNYMNDLFTFCIKYNQFELLQTLHLQGAKWDEDNFIEALSCSKHGINTTIIDYMIKNDDSCITEKVLSYALVCGNFKIFKQLFEKGYPYNLEQIIEYSVMKNEPSLIKLIHEKVGLTSCIYKYCLMFCRQNIFEFAIENNVPFERLRYNDVFKYQSMENMSSEDSAFEYLLFEYNKHGIELDVDLTSMICDEDRYNFCVDKLLMLYDNENQ